jgi:acetyl-CoA acyltransferase
MSEAFLCDAVRTPFGRYGGSLSGVRTDDLAALPLRVLVERNQKVDWQAVDDVIYGCANQAGEDNRNVARMALLLAGLSPDVPGATVNRLCGSSMEAAGVAARAIRCGEAELVIVGGVESMSRAPFVMGKADAAFSRTAEVYDTTIGWRFVNPAMKSKYGTDSMPETAENVAEEFHVRREDQDAFAWRTQQRWAKANAAGFFKHEIVPVTLPQKKGEPKVFAADEHPRPDTTLEALAKLKPVVKPTGTVTAGNSSGINDGACAMILASEAAAKKYGLTPQARVLGAASAGVLPRAAQTRRFTNGRDRAERSVRGAGLGRDAATGVARRRRECEPKWRRDRDRASAGRKWRAAGDDSGLSVGGDQRQLRAVHDVHRGGPRDRTRARAVLSAVSAITHSQTRRLT